MKVILIDRYPVLGDHLKRFLTTRRPDLEYGGQAFGAEDGTALAKACAPGIVLLEPLIFGYASQTIAAGLEDLHAAVPESRLILISSLESTAYLRAALRVGASDYLTKPVDPSDLLLALNRCAAVPDRSGTAGAQPDARYADNIVSLIRCGNQEGALDQLREFQRAQEGARGMYSDWSIGCLKIATEVIRLPDDMDSVPEALIEVYHELIRAMSRNDSIAAMETAMEDFVRQSAELFDCFSRDHGARLVENAKQYVETHLKEPLTLELLASRFYISSAYFSRLFKSRTGQTFSGYLAERRIERAKTLLRSSIPVSEVALQVGYEEPNSFARRFKAQVGIPPSLYRQQALEQGRGPGRGQ